MAALPALAPAPVPAPVAAAAAAAVAARAPQWYSQRGGLERILRDLAQRTNAPLLLASHARALRLGLLHNPDPSSFPHLLVSSYSFHGRLLSALSLARLSPLSLGIFNALIGALSDHRLPLPALRVFSRMLALDFPPEPFTFVSLLRASPSLPSLRTLHTHILKSPAALSDRCVPNALLHAYSLAGDLPSARSVFLSMPHRDLVSWNSMLAALIRAADLPAARRLFNEMPCRDSISFNTMLYGLAVVGLAEVAFELFRAMPSRNVVSWSTVIAAFCTSGDLDTARQLFDKMPAKNLVTWTAMVSAYARKGMAKAASTLFAQMTADPGLCLDAIAVVAIVSACTESGMLGLGSYVHKWIMNSGFQCTTDVCNALLNMYGKCGRLGSAWRVFEQMRSRNLVSWNSMIHCLAIHGNGRKALELFSEMEKEQVQPDHVTFVAVLCACAHVGLVEEAWCYFKNMERKYGVHPSIEHYGCMVDLLGRRGLLMEAFDLLSSMPFEPNEVIYGSFLASCKMHNNLGFAEAILDKLRDQGSIDPGFYATISNVYATMKYWDVMAKARLQMKETGVPKPSGSSCIEVGEVMHEFTAADRSHPQTAAIIKMLDWLSDDLGQDGYAPNGSSMAP